MKTQEFNKTDTPENDGTLLPMDCIAVCPFSDEDLAAFVAQVPVSLAGELARMAAWRALGMAAPAPKSFDS